VSERDREPGEDAGRQGPSAEAARDPRGGAQSDAYRHADPRDLVEEDGVVMSGPGGAPQEREPESSGA
jgi:hypothetical protein